MMAPGARPSDCMFWVISTCIVFLFVTVFRLWISPRAPTPRLIHQCEIVWKIEDEEGKVEHADIDINEEFAPLFVLLWTPLDGHYGNWERHLGAGYNAFVERCEDGPDSRRCVFTDDRAMLDESALVVFSINDLGDDLYEDREVWAQSELPPLTPNGRPPGQMWALFWRDPPSKVKMSTDKLSFLDGVFNWTISYRRDADVFYHFGMFKVKQATLIMRLWRCKGDAFIFILGHTSRHQVEHSIENVKGEERYRLGKKPRPQLWAPK